MSEMTRTMTFAGVAVGLLAAAAIAAWIPTLGKSSAGIEDQGELFFPEFAKELEDDPLTARVLEIVEYDSDTASVSPFQVQFQNGQWTIPSHHDYPAKAEDRLARLAAAVASMKKDTIRSDRAEDHEALGVVDPLDSKVTSLRGRGTHVTLKDRPGGRVLADFIVGAPVPDRPEMRYVRPAGKNRTYGVNLSLDLSTDFANWIDTNLVDIPVPDVNRIEYDTRKVDPEQFTVIPGDPIVLDKEPAPAGAQANWTLEGNDTGEPVNRTKVEDVIRAVDGLRVVGVRPLPQQSSNDVLMRSLASKGFYFTRQGDLLSNEGSIRLGTNDGIRYNLRFGEVTFASGDALTAGTDEDKRMAGEDLIQKDESAESESPENKEGTESRYVYVNAEFDESLLPADPAPEGLPEDVFARDPNDPARLEAEKKAREREERLAEQRATRIEAGRKKAEELNETFKNWYYVVPGADFRRVFIGREAFLEPSTPAAPGGAMPPSIPGMEGGLPPGLNLPGLQGSAPN